MLLRNIFLILVVVTNISLATSTQLIEDPLSISPINNQSAMFSALELHDMCDL